MEEIGLLRKLSTKHEAVIEVRGEHIAHIVKDLIVDLEEESKANRMTGKQKKQILLQVMRIVLSELSYFIFKELISELVDLYVDFARGKIIQKKIKQ